MSETTAPPSREAAIAARLLTWADELQQYQDAYERESELLRDAAALLAHLQQARQERDSAREERRRILDEYRKALAQSDAALQQAREALAAVAVWKQADAAMQGITSRVPIEDHGQNAACFDALRLAIVGLREIDCGLAAALKAVR